MDTEDYDRRAASFGTVAQVYAENRPDYPAEAVSWLAGGTPARILELGSGTGKLTTPLLTMGHDVVATDPSTSMLAQLRRVASGARTVAGRAESIPLTTSACDVVVSAQAFHWFNRERALPEIARVLRPGGVLGLVWNTGDFKVPWVRKVLSLIDLFEDEVEDPLAGSDLFTTHEHRVFRHWQRFDRETLLGFIASSSASAVRPPDERAALLAEVGAIYDSYGRGHDGMRMPWKATCYRATVSALAVGQRDAPAGPDDGLLIDFR